MSAPGSRRALLRWSGWFIAANIGLYCLLGLRYLLIYRFPNDLAGYLYVPLALVGQMSLLAAVPLGLILLPLALLWPRRGALHFAGALLAALGLSLLLLDTQVFAQNRFHLRHCSNGRPGCSSGCCSVSSWCSNCCWPARSGVHSRVGQAAAAASG